MTPYLLDTNFFIQAYRDGFPMDVVPSFWNKVEELAAAGKIISIDKVRNEIFLVEDDLKLWCLNHLPDSFFEDSTSILDTYTQIISWAYSRLNDPYSQQAIDIFLDADEADAWLIAYACAQHLPLVTNEISAPQSKKSIKIPDACLPFGVRTLSSINLFRELGERF